MIRSLFRRSTLYFLGLAVGKALNVWVFILFARTLLPAKFGDLVLYMTIGQIVTFIADFGLNQWYQKKAHTENQTALFNKLLNARTFTLLLSVILSGLAFIFFPVFSRFVVFIFLVALAPFGLLSVLDGYYFEKNDSFKVAAKTILRAGIFLIGFWIFKDNFSLEAAILIYLIGDCIVLLWFFPWKMLKGFHFTSGKEILAVLKNSFPYAFLVLTSFAYARGDSLVIRAVLTSTALGIYGAAYRFLEGVSLLPTALSHNLFPVAAKERAVSAMQTVKLSFFMGSIGLAVSLFMYFGAPWFVPLLLGEAYTEAIKIVQIFSAPTLLFFISAPLNTVVLSSRLIQKFLPLGLANTALNIVLNICLVPVYGIAAAALVMLITEVTGLLINIYFLRKVYEH